MVETGRNKKDLPFFDDNGSFVPLWLANQIMEDNYFVTHEETGEIYYYEDGIYKPKAKHKIQEICQKRLGKFARVHYINETLEAIKRLTFTPRERFGNPKDCIAVKNGLLNVKTEELKDFAPEYVHLTKINAKYNPDVDCPKIKKFVSELVNDEDVKIIQEMFGYCLIKDYPLAKAFMLLGSGANGKSTLIELLETFLGGDNIATPSIHDLLYNRFSKIELYGKLANLHADISSNKLSRTGTFKMLTGGDTIRGEKKYQNSFQFKNHAKLIYSANELPKTEDKSKAFFRRWVVIDFPYKFDETDEDTNPNLPHSIIDEEELSGLLNWALKGLHKVLKRGEFSQTKTRDKIKEKWIMQTDSMRGFVDLALEQKKDSLVPKDGLYELYKEFCNQNNLEVESKRNFTQDMNKYCPYSKITRPRKGNNRPRCWDNIVVKPSFVKRNKTYNEMWSNWSNNFNLPIGESEKSNIYKKSSQIQLDQLDQDNNSTTTKTNSKRVKKAKKLIPKYLENFNVPVDIEKINGKWFKDWPRKTIDMAIKNLKKNNVIFEPKKGKVKLL